MKMINSVMGEDNGSGPHGSNIVMQKGHSEQLAKSKDELQPQEDNKLRNTEKYLDMSNPLEESKDTRVDDNDQEDPDEEEQEEINFDQLLGDAAQSQAEFEEDREDSIEDEDEMAIGDGLDYSLSYTKTANAAILKPEEKEEEKNVEVEAQPKQDEEND